MSASSNLYMDVSLLLGLSKVMMQTLLSTVNDFAISAVTLCTPPNVNMESTTKHILFFIKSAYLITVAKLILFSLKTKQFSLKCQLLFEIFPRVVCNPNITAFIRKCQFHDNIIKNVREKYLFFSTKRVFLQKKT